jgi:hypothetical protein
MYTNYLQVDAEAIQSKRGVGYVGQFEGAGQVTLQMREEGTGLALSHWWLRIP